MKHKTYKLKELRFGDLVRIEVFLDKEFDAKFKLDGEPDIYTAKFVAAYEPDVVVNAYNMNGKLHIGVVDGTAGRLYEYELK